MLKATDGATGVETALAQRPDAIIMDIGLPDVDGWSAVTTIRKTAKLPVIALTAHATAFDRERALQVGCDDFETKPVEFPRLLAKLEALLAQRRS